MSGAFAGVNPFLIYLDHERWLKQARMFGVDGRLLPEFIDSLEVEVGDVDGKMVSTNIFRYELVQCLESIRCVEMLYRFSPHLSNILTISSKDEDPSYDVMSDDTTMYRITHTQSGTVMCGISVWEQADDLVDFLMQKCPIDLVTVMRDWLATHPLRTVYVQVDRDGLLRTMNEWLAVQIPPPDEEEPPQCA